MRGHPPTLTIAFLKCYTSPYSLSINNFSKEAHTMRLKFYSATMGFLFLFLFLSGTGEVRAQGRNIAAETLCEHAQTFYERGQKKEAIHEFSKVLLVDPDNPTAHDYLARLGAPQGIYRPLKTVTVHRRDAQEPKSSAADQEFNKLNDVISKKDQEIFHLKDTLSRTLQLQKDKMDDQDKKEEALIEEPKAALPVPIEAVEKQEVENQEDLKQLVKVRDEDIAGLKEELAFVKKNILSLSPASSDLKSQIRSVQLELTETQMSLKEKEEILMELKKQLDETAQRNELVQKIIQEKDSQIKKLQNPQKILP